MTNIDRAAELLWLPEPHLSSSECGDQARELAQALADAGLLMPDLPEPAEHDGITYFGDAPEICAYCDGQVYGLDDGVWRPTKPADLRADAAAMLAAADYAERNQK